MITAADAIKIYNKLLTNNIPVWITGGWGIDALLGKQTRPHKDLDVLMHADHIHQACQIIEKEGFSSKKLWSENSSDQDAFGNVIDTAFILLNPEESGLDVHAIRFDASGNGIPAWDEAEDFFFTAEDLDGQGVIGETSVRCISVQSQITCHSGYELPEYQIPDMEVLQGLLKNIEEN